MQNLFKPLLILLLCLIALPEVYAQYVEGDQAPKSPPPKDTVITVPKKKGFDSSRLVPGGNLALNFGNPFYIDVSPSLGYLVTDQFLLGLGVTYIAIGSTYNNTKYNFHYYGGRVLARHKLFDSFYANAELDVLNVPYFIGRGLETNRIWTVNPLVGASYIVPFGRRGGVQATLLYNLNYQPAYSPYSSALIWRVGFFL